MRRLAAHFESEEVSTKMEAFFAAHCKEFAGPEGEQKLENTEVTSSPWSVVDHVILCTYSVYSSS